MEDFLPKINFSKNPNKKKLLLKKNCLNTKSISKNIKNKKRSGFHHCFPSKY